MAANLAKRALIQHHSVSIDRCQLESDNGCDDMAANNVDPDAIMNKVRAELQEQQMQELVQTLSEKCFAKCVHKPSTSLSSSELACISKCVDRYFNAMTLVFTAVAKRAQQAA